MAANLLSNFADLPPMGRFHSSVQAEQLDDGRWCLLAPLVYTMGREDEVKIVVPVGTTTDFASIPRLLRWLLDPADPQYLRAAVVHDLLYERRGVARVVADAILVDGMRALGCPCWKRALVYAGVRLGGWWAWRLH